jgi:hypothetical protein
LELDGRKQGRQQILLYRKQRTMIEVNYEWKRLANDGTLKDIQELTADDKNWFDSRDEAIEWLKKKKHKL